jgi:hypothetical protein
METKLNEKIYLNLEFKKLFLKHFEFRTLFIYPIGRLSFKGIFYGEHHNENKMMLSLPFYQKPSENSNGIAINKAKQIFQEQKVMAHGSASQMPFSHSVKFEIKKSSIFETWKIKVIGVHEEFEDFNENQLYDTILKLMQFVK